MEDIFQPDSELGKLHEAVESVKSQISKIIVGQEELLELMIVAMLAEGHILVEGVPGVAKTLAAKVLAKSVHVPFSRIQFTPDLMPGDVIGTSIFHPRDLVFNFKKGPVFSNIVLIDEINRAPAKTQSALFEVMEERQVTMDGKTYLLDRPFMVVATQNPVEHEGTYRLPEAQLDRFIFKLNVNYPSLEQEVQILEMQQHHTAAELLNHLEPLLTTNDLLHYTSVIRGMVVEPRLLEFIAQIVGKTRNNPALYLGASPRASLAILKASKALAAVKMRSFVVPEDILTVALPVLRHRVILSPEKEMEGVDADGLLEQVIARVEVPR